MQQLEDVAQTFEDTAIGEASTATPGLPPQISTDNGVHDDDTPANIDIEAGNDTQTTIDQVAAASSVSIESNGIRKCVTIQLSASISNNHGHLRRANQHSSMHAATHCSSQHAVVAAALCQGKRHTRPD